MNAASELHPLVAIVGPTASGKSALAVSLAERLGGEILACDSTQLYRGFDIGTAKLRIEERRGIAHHLMDLYDPSQPSTAGEYRRLAIEVLADLRRRKCLPLLTVGTGLYLRALLEGLADAPPRSDELRARMRESAAEHGAGRLHRILSRLDREAAARIAPRDVQKIIRAVEICLLARRPVSEIHRGGRAPLESYRPIKVGLLPPRALLYSRMDARVQAMLERGWLDEVRGLLAAGLPEDAKPFDFIGYRELRAHLRGEMSLAEAAAAIAQATRRYAKRQITWFRKESGVRWLEAFGDDPGAQAAALAWVRQELASLASRAPAREGV